VLGRNDSRVDYHRSDKLVLARGIKSFNVASSPLEYIVANAGLTSWATCELARHIKHAARKFGACAIIHGGSHPFLAVMLCGTVLCAMPTIICGADIAPASLVKNGSFEAAIAKDPSRPAAWYYVQQMQVVDAADAPHGRRYVRFRNTVPGRTAHAQQHLALDGRKVRALDASLWIAVRDAGPGQALSDQPSVRIRFYDADDAQVGEETLGPWAGARAWSQVQTRIVVPESTRLALVVIGLAGGTGEADFDQLELTPADVNASALPPRVRP
jgi:hypothetical protein